MLIDYLPILLLLVLAAIFAVVSLVGLRRCGRGTPTP